MELLRQGPAYSNGLSSRSRSSKGRNSSGFSSRSSKDRSSANNRVSPRDPRGLRRNGPFNRERLLRKGALRKVRQAGNSFKESRRSTQALPKENLRPAVRSLRGMRRDVQFKGLQPRRGLFRQDLQCKKNGQGNLKRKRCAFPLRHSFCSALSLWA